MTLFTDSELDTVMNAGRILARKKVDIRIALVHYAPESKTAQVLREQYHELYRTLANYPDWRKLNEEV